MFFEKARKQSYTLGENSTDLVVTYAYTHIQRREERYFGKADISSRNTFR